MFDDITLRITQPSDFPEVRRIVNPYKNKINNENKHTEYYNDTGRWLVGHSVLINPCTMLHFFVTSEHKEQAEHGYLEFMSTLQ